jgi:hypothetical protein
MNSTIFASSAISHKKGSLTHSNLSKKFLDDMPIFFPAMACREEIYSLKFCNPRCLSPYTASQLLMIFLISGIEKQMVLFINLSYKRKRKQHFLST